MIFDQERFDMVEQALRESGHLTRYEKEKGPVTGRMMIVSTEPPEDIEIECMDGKCPVCFEASFDFYDTVVGLAIYPDTLKPASGIWLRQQTDQKEDVDKVWIEFFIQKLMENLQSDEGWYADTVYSFVNDYSDFTFIPARMEDGDSGTGV